MRNNEKDLKKVVPPSKLVGFSWGGTTPEWEAEADQIISAIDEINNEETNEKTKDNAESKLRWNFWY